MYYKTRIRASHVNKTMLYFLSILFLHYSNLSLNFEISHRNMSNGTKSLIDLLNQNDP